METDTDKLKARFPSGLIVYLIPDAYRMFPKLKGRKAVVIGIARNGTVKVIFEGRKTVTAWSAEYLSRTSLRLASKPEGEQ